MKQRIWLLSILVVCVVVGAFAATHFMGNKMSPTAVAQVKGIAVEQEEFFDTKQNHALLRSLDHYVPDASDEQIIERLLKPKLIDQEAIRRGIKVPEEDIDEEIAFQRENLDQIDPNDEKDAWVLELMTRTYEIKGRTAEEHWQSERARAIYRHGFYAMELRKEMRENEEITTWEEFEDYQQSLYDQVRDDIVYNYDLIDETNATLDEEWPL